MVFSALPGPTAYERYYVPRLFEPWARWLLGRMRVGAGERLLDVATGPGTLPRLAANLLGPTGSVVGTDLSLDMLAIARAKPSATGAPIRYVAAHAAPLPLEDGAFDVVTCQQGLQFFPDPHEALVEMRRVLTAGGRAGVAVWGPLAECQHFAAVDAAIDEAGMPASWHDGMRAPFRRPDVETMRDDLRGAGFADVAVETPELPLCFEGGIEQELESLAVTPLAGPLDALAPEARARFLEALRRRLAPYARPDGVVTSMRAVVGFGRR